MNNFLKTYRLALTPLSPIHIGCGEDFEPTNYVIDDGVLYGFDPSRAVLEPRQRDELSKLGLNADLLGIQLFFRDNKQPFKISADVMIPVASGIAREYQQKLGKVVQRESSQRDVFNKLTVERAMSTGAARAPFIPGSSLKGAIRTTHLNDINGHKPLQHGEDRDKGSTKLEQRLYEEKDFDMSPMRLVKVGDLMSNADIHRSIVYAVMRRKRFVVDRDTGEEKQTQDNLATRKEVILQGQYRCLDGDLTLMQLGDTPESNKTPKRRLQPTDLKAIAKTSNAFHLPKLEEEIKLLGSRRFANEQWLSVTKKLLDGELGAKLGSGDAFLVRLGRYGGAESKTLDGIRKIHIPQAKRIEDKYVASSHCIWLASNDAKARSDLLPFGWAVVEIDPEGDLPQLKTWCTEQSKDRPDMAKIRQQFAAEKTDAIKRKTELAAQAAQREATRQAGQLAATQREQALANMSEQGKLIETLRQACEDWAARISNGNFKKQGADAGKAGLFQDANKLVALALATPGWTEPDKQALASMLEEWLPKVAAPWGKDERKKLKIAALRVL